MKRGVLWIKFQQKISSESKKEMDKHLFTFVKNMKQFYTIFAYKMLLNEVDVADCLQETELCAWEK